MAQRVASLDSARSGCAQLLDARIVADHVGHDGRFMATVLFAPRHHTVPGRLLRAYNSGSTARPGNQRRSHRIVRRLAYVVHSGTAELTRWLLSLRCYLYVVISNFVISTTKIVIDVRSMQ